MGFSKSNRIITLLAIDSAFFLLELTVGYSVHSLALVADSFHMLNDVLSLCVGLWAVQVANQKADKTNFKMYTYGWQRAETLGALVNGVFLVALCLSIFLDAIQRIVEPQAVLRPKLVLIVGCLGLASNILGLFLFHEHGHSHEKGHRSADAESPARVEEGRSHAVPRGVAQVDGRDAHTDAVLDEGGNIADVLPQNTIAGWPKTKDPPQWERTSVSKGFTKSDEDDSTAGGSTSPLPIRPSQTSGASRKHRQHPSASTSLPRHPLIARKLEDIESTTSSYLSDEEAIDEDNETERSPLLAGPKTNGSIKHKQHPSNSEQKPTPSHRDSWQTKHKHSQPKESSTGSQSHSDLNMRGVFLHVMGDALGNIGVILSALLIWLTNYSWRYYSDPAISLVITLIILGSAIPLCKAASRILLQAVPRDINVDRIRDDIENLDGVGGCHHLHVWQLSDTKPVASLHIRLKFDFKGEGVPRYMQLARAVQRCLHEHRIHESTIQPEFCLAKDHHHASRTMSDSEDSERDEGLDRPRSSNSEAASRKGGPDTCLLDCGDECGDESERCCNTAAVEATKMSEETRR